ncbi:hypothetical protein BDV96DRAFT_614721 [Lophiotrema nucula]|uniref:Rhodopsin domain-containing protein n=1 Tax=Lophiotrema nucula TaxID=690887 RepID=A0A6A5YVX2_9PLEO|nr:hypothetical protein BDV96DRAFT_614721 [Lophiotrema nucula]
MTKSVPIENGLQVGTLVASAISIALVVVSVGLRLLAKSLSAGFDYSDYCIVGALLANTALHTCCMVLVTHGGFGFHTMDIYVRFGPDTATFFFKGIMTFAILWNVTVCFSKLSVLLMYHSLIPMKSLLRWAQGIGMFVILWNICNIIAGFLICRPLARNWDFAIPGTCGSQPNFYFSMGIVNIITDIFILGLPLPYLYRLKMAMKKRLLAMGLLTIGVGTWVITIYRQTMLPGLDFADMTYSGVLATILSGLEPAVAIALACVPLMRPLFPSHRRRNNTKSSHYNYSSGGDSGLYSSKSKRGAVELASDGDSEVELQPTHQKPVQNVDVNVRASTWNVEGHSDESLGGDQRGQNIKVERRWEVTSAHLK